MSGCARRTPHAAVEQADGDEGTGIRWNNPAEQFGGPRPLLRTAEPQEEGRRILRPA